MPFVFSFNFILICNILPSIKVFKVDIATQSLVEGCHPELVEGCHPELVEGCHPELVEGCHPELVEG
jgi:hypothetical protein